MRYKKIFAVLAVVVFAAVFAGAEQAPDFKLQDMNGNVVQLSSFRGKVVFLDFWASWCPPCRASIPAVKALHKNMASNPNVVLLGINAGESKSTVEKFMKNNGMEYTVLLGDNDAMKNFKVNGIPAFFIIDKNGNIAKQYVGYSKGLEKDWDTQINALLGK